MRDRQVCVDCGTLSPETETNYTLISSQFGWRLTRMRLPDGTFNVEWRCPSCWKEHKKKRVAEEESRAARMSSLPPALTAPQPQASDALSNRPLPSFPSTAPRSPSPPRRPSAPPLRPLSPRPLPSAADKTPTLPPPIPPRLPRPPR